MKNIRITTALAFVCVALIVSAAAGLLSAPTVAHASVWDDVLRFLKLAPEASTSASSSPSVALYRPVIDYEAAVTEAVENASPSVVSIVISKDVPVIEQCPYDPFGNLPPGFQDFFGGGTQFTQPCQKGTQKQDVGGGSGFVISADGLVLTNKHVVSDTAADYTVILSTGKKYTAKVLARDPVQDLAVVKIEATGLTPVTLGDSAGLKLGQTAIAIGNSLGEFQNTVSVGVISGLSRTITASGGSFGSETIQGVIQTDAAINPGNSGGPLLNLKGEVVGINTAIASNAQNVGFAIPVNRAKRVIESVKQSGKITVPYLGVRYLTIDDALAKDQKLPVTSGALVRGNQDGPAVMPDSPAAKAGVQAEDIITAVNGTALTADTPLSALVQDHSVGDVLSLSVRRGDQTLTLSVTLTERPAGQ